jgi:hypothetical protein
MSILESGISVVSQHIPQCEQRIGRFYSHPHLCFYGAYDLVERSSNDATPDMYVQKVFTLMSPKEHFMRAIDAKILDELGMLYGDKDCFYPLREWFGTAERHWANLERLFMVADYAKKHYPSMTEKIAAYRQQIADLFHQIKTYARGWKTEYKEKHRLSTKDYIEATDERWDALDKWAVTQEKLRCLILEYVDFLYSVVSES